MELVQQALDEAGVEPSALCCIAFTKVREHCHMREGH